MTNQFFAGLITLAVLTGTFAQAQVDYSSAQNVRISAPTFTNYHGVEGSPYIPSDTVKNGWIMLGNKRVPTKLRYNTQTGEVEYVQGDRILAPVNQVSAFVILAPDTLHFQKGFPAVGTRSATDFYQILFEGRKTKLVRYIYANVKSNTDAMSIDYGQKKYSKREEYYVWLPKGQPTAENYFLKVTDGELKPVTANKKTLISLFPQQADQIDKYIADQKLKLKSWAEFASVLRWVDAQ
ncbi:hypothetical protein [Spirosoma foliorum]|uniref:Uncharacterized protein n=1 Tax=Spirosoma foliorum TaxID=2710596 RepID=A0A7G5H587_9BACT|nr:hypothetical protein [Spirosoma foliorum]QMW06279.1 hypothetical protein H3H32_16035 [Spirosoma foliorum]